MATIRMGLGLTVFSPGKKRNTFVTLCVLVCRPYERENVFTSPFGSQ